MKDVKIKVLYESSEKILTLEEIAELLKPYLDSIENCEVKK